MVDDIVRMARVEREMEIRFEQCCETEGWIASVSMSPGGRVSLLLEKFGENAVGEKDLTRARECLLSFCEREFSGEFTHELVGFSVEKIPMTRAPYHVSYHVNVVAPARIAELAA